MSNRSFVPFLFKGNIKKRIGVKKKNEEEESDVLHAWTKHVSHS